MLASVYSYRVMVKSVSSCCVRGRWVLSNPATIDDEYESSNIASQKEVFLVISHNGAIPIYQLNIQCMHRPHCH